MNFSVLMSIYHKENADFFHQAMESLWDKQSLKPTEIILVEDGKLTAKIYEAIKCWENELSGILKRVPLTENQGLGKALNVGLNHCQYELVARMDADDVCINDRFEKQIDYFMQNQNVDLLGGQVEEFTNQVGDYGSGRVLPTNYEAIVKFAKQRNPFNHPTVMYRKSAVQKAGGYQSDYLCEDYALWVRMICAGAVVANLPDKLLYMRAGDAMFYRRGGLKYAVEEAKAQYKFYKLGFLSLFELIKNLVIRLPVRLLPNHLRAYFYKWLLRKKL